MKIIGVIPARFGSTRFPGKPLSLLKNKPMLQWVVEGAQKSHLLQSVVVATDDKRIVELCDKIDVQSILTPSDCLTGTDRIFAAVKNIDFDVVINIQGDEPLIDETFIDPLAKAFVDNNKLDMATLAHSITEDDLNNLNAVKVIKNINNEAVYFSRFPIPYSRQNFSGGDVVMKHIGLYGYSRGFLQKFCTAPQSELEKLESLEQLRALYLGAKIKVIKVEKATYGVDTPEDLQKLEALLK